MSLETEVLSMRASDVPAMVSIHESAFPGFFLTFLGAGFLRVLYAALVDDPDVVTPEGRAMNEYLLRLRES